MKKVLLPLAVFILISGIIGAVIVSGANKYSGMSKEQKITLHDKLVGEKEKKLKNFKLFIFKIELKGCMTL